MLKAKKIALIVILENILVAVRETGIIGAEEIMTREEFKRTHVNKGETKWKEKKMHGQYVRELGEDVDTTNTWKWLQKGDLKGTTEALICSAQEQAL